MRPAMVSGMLAIAVKRCSQKSSVPLLAEPKPRTRPSGVRMLMFKDPSTHPRQRQDCPQQDGRGDRADDVGAHQPFALVVFQPIAEVPDQIAKPAKQVVEECPGEAEQDEQAD